MLQEPKPTGNAVGNVLEKKTAVGGGLGKLLENKQGGSGAGIAKAGLGQLLNKTSGNAAEKKVAGIGNLLGKKGGGAAAAPFGKMSMGAFGKRGGPKAAQVDDQQGILEGISSLHSWIKSQTMIKPNQKMKGKGQMYEEVSSSVKVLIKMLKKNLKALIKNNPKKKKEIFYGVSINELMYFLFIHNLPIITFMTKIIAMQNMRFFQIGTG